MNEEKASKKEKMDAVMIDEPDAAKGKTKCYKHSTDWCTGQEPGCEKKKVCGSKCLID